MNKEKNINTSQCDNISSSVNIPNGMYCHDENGKVCPYWKDMTVRIRKYCTGYHDTETCGFGCGRHDAYCSYLNKRQTEQEGLLWDKVKICGVKPL